MVKLEWGKKRICSACGLKYYDFNKSPITCPTCSVVFDPDLYLKSRKGKILSSKVEAEKNVDVSDVDDNETEESVTDEDTIIELNNDVKDSEDETEVSIDDDVSFVDEDDINGENIISVDVEEDKKN